MGEKILTGKNVLIIIISLSLYFTSCSVNRVATSGSKEGDNSTGMMFKPKSGIRAPYRTEYYKKLRSQLAKEYTKHLK